MLAQVFAWTPPSRWSAQAGGVMLLHGHVHVKLLMLVILLWIANPPGCRSAFGPSRTVGDLEDAVMDLTRLAVDAGQFINRAVQVKSFASLRSECVMLAPCAHKCAVNGVKLLFCFSTRERTSARRTGRSWSPGWRSCWPWRTPPRPARTRSCPRRRSYCSPTPVRAGPILSYFTKLDFYHTAWSL